MIRHTCALFVLALCVTAAAAPAMAQQTRAAQIAAEQSDKATRLHPYVPSSAEKLLVRVNTALTGTPNGLYPNIGSVYSGGGLAVGPGYRRFYGDRTYWDVKSLLSIKAYKLVELGTESPGHARGRLDLFAGAGWRDATQVAFYGVGNNAPNNARTNFRMKETNAVAGLRGRPFPTGILGGAISYEDFRIGEGAGTQPSVTRVHTPLTAPGLGVNPAYVHSTASAGIDWRPSPGYARRGGLYEIQYHSYVGQGDVDSFDRVDLNLVQHIPILRENWVLSLRGQAQTTLDDTDSVPFFLLPSLGSGSTLRAYNSWRFRDRHSMLLSAEWRWIPSSLALDMALFYDMGKVAARRGDLNFDDLKGDVGIGARFHGPAATPLRIELAHGRDGFHLVLSGGPAF